MLSLDMREYLECTQDEKLSCVPLIDEITDLAVKAAEGGLLSLESAAPGLDNYLLKTGITLIVDGVPPGIVEDILDSFILSSGKTGVELLKQIVVREGVLSMQYGLYPQTLELKLLTLLGEEIFSNI